MLINRSGIFSADLAVAKNPMCTMHLCAKKISGLNYHIVQLVYIEKKCPFSVLGKC